MTVEKKIENAGVGAPIGPLATPGGGKLEAFLQDIEPFFYRRPLVYVDVGAHRGDIFAELCASSLKIQEAHLVEPNPTSFAALERKVAALEAGAIVTCHHIALSDRPGRLRLRDADTMTKVIGAAGAEGPADPKAFEVEARALDALAEGFTIPHVSLLKIDVEGHETKVLQGARRLLEAQAIDLIYIEAGIDPNNPQQAYYRGIEDLLRPYHYRLFRIYEQTHEWLDDSPLLRRVNLAFMSSAFAERNPYRLSRDLMGLRKALEAERRAAREQKQKLQAAEIELNRAQAVVTTRFVEIAELTKVLETERRAAAAAASAQEKRLQAVEIELNRAQAARSKLAAELSDVQAAQRELAAARDAAQDRLSETTRTLQATQSELSLLRGYGRELEDRLRSLLESRSWRVLEPARSLSRRLKGRKAPQPFVSRLAPGGALVDPKVVAATAAARGEPPVSDIVAKLWGGFSQSAQADLAQIASASDAGTADRVAAAWNLARWRAATQDWQGCLSYLLKIAALDKKFFRARRTRILLIEAYTRTGEPAKAIHYAEHGLQNGSDGNYACGIANALLAGNTAGGATRVRLEQLNRIYAAEGLAPLALRDPVRGLAFGNLETEAAPAVVRETKISVLMAVYNASDFLETAIASLLAQTWTNLEIVAVDDASRDDSWEKLERLATRDPRLRVFRNENNLGAYPTRNRALAEATGNLITVHDSDDWSHAQMLEVQAAAFLETPETKGTFSAMARVRPNLEFLLRPERNNLDYVHRSYPSMMLRREDLAQLHQWDGVSANADDELVQRARVAWGETALRDVLPTTPLSFFLNHGQSITEQKGTHLKSLSFGIRREYAQQAEFWRRSMPPERIAAGASMERTDLKTPFPIPAGLAPKTWPRNAVYDLVVVSDLGLLGGTRRCNERYIEAATELGMRVGLFHWPRYDLRLSDIAPEYRRLSYRTNVDILVPEDAITADTVLIHHPPILKHRIDAVPQIAAQRVAILVNQLPMQLRGDPPHYYFPDKVAALCAELFGHNPVWLPISPLTRRILAETGGYQPIADADWFPPLGRDLPDGVPPARSDVGADRPIVLGRHSRDHWTKWPATAAALEAAYCAETDISVRLMGGAQGALKLLKRLPSNWTSIGFDATPVDHFLSELDFFLHFTHEDYIEEFGRNVMEAMAQGVPTILPPAFVETFGDAALYCTPDEVAATVRRVWADPDVYRAQAAKGYAFVQRTSAHGAVATRLAGLVRTRSAADAVTTPAR